MSNTDQTSTPSLSSSSSTISSRPTSPSLSTTNLKIINNQPIKIKSLDLNSYFSDLDGEEDYNNQDEISKLKSSNSNLTKFNSNSNFIQFDQIETLNSKKNQKFGIEYELEKLEKFNLLLSSSSSKTSIKLEEESRTTEEEEIFSEEVEEEEDDDDQEEDQEWVKTQWNSLIQKQIIREKEIRKLILSRQVLQPLDLKKWLDSDQTCDLPALSLGVLLRMDPLASSSNQISTISKY